MYSENKNIEEDEKYRIIFLEKLKKLETEYLENKKKIVRDYEIVLKNLIKK